MSHHYNNLTDLRGRLETTMMLCWQEGRKLINSNPHEGEIYFIVGNACMELIKKIQDEQTEEMEKWHI